jgi:uncharacterized protein (TIGR00297 family)
MADFRLITVATFSGIIGSNALWIAAIVTVVFTSLARFVKGVSRSGAAAGAVICFALIAFAGLGAFVGLISVFGLTWIATRFGYRRKQTLGIAERPDGRKASQVSANLGVAAACAIFYRLSHHNSLFLLAMVAAFAEAGADTVSSELGQTANRQPRLITTWDQVPAGTNGAVSIIGTVSGVLSAAVIAGISIAVGLLPWQYLPNCLGSAAAGMFFDSVLGASLERQGRIGNDAVNLLSTLLAAILAAATVLLFSVK